jgi:hypothetical protein
VAFLFEKKKYQLTKIISEKPKTVTKICDIIDLSPGYGLNSNLRNLNEFETTETELKAIAAEAKMGFNRTPKKG